MSLDWALNWALIDCDWFTWWNWAIQCELSNWVGEGDLALGPTSRYGLGLKARPEPVNAEDSEPNDLDWCVHFCKYSPTIYFIPSASLHTHFHASYIVDSSNCSGALPHLARGYRRSTMSQVGDAVPRNSCASLSFMRNDAPTHCHVTCARDTLISIIPSHLWFKIIQLITSTYQYMITTPFLITLKLLILTPLSEMTIWYLTLS